MAKMFEVQVDSVEFDPAKFETPEAAYFALTSTDPVTVAVCATIEEAREVLASVSINAQTFTPWGMKKRLVNADVAFIVEDDYEWDDEEQKWERTFSSPCCDIWDFVYDPKFMEA